ncbi:MAG: DnaJ domain-containing protein [Burkholderiales bacterium]
MAIRKTLYEVLQVSRNASDDVIRSAYEARLRELGSSAAPEVLAERNLIREAHAILSDATRRKLYDAKLRDEAMRALGIANGTHVASPVSATIADRSSPLGWMIGVAVLATVAIGGSWTYLGHKRAMQEVRLEEARLAEQKRVQEEAAERERQNAEWAKTQFEQRQKEAEMRQWEAQRARDRASSHSVDQHIARQHALEERQKAQERAAQQRIEMENARRTQLQLEREKRYVRELERDRAMRF